MPNITENRDGLLSPKTVTTVLTLGKHKPNVPLLTILYSLLYSFLFVAAHSLKLRKNYHTSISLLF